MIITPLTLPVVPGSSGWDTPDFVKPRLGDAFNTSHPAVAASLYRELAVTARVHSIAVAMRGVQDQGFQHHLVWRRVVESVTLPAGVPAPTWEFFFDTGSWYHNAADGSFDFGNASHWERAWRDIIRPMFETFDDRGHNQQPNPIRMTRLPDGRHPVTLWSIVPGLNASHTAFVNQHRCGDFLREMARRVELEFAKTVAWSVDRSWHDYDPFGPYWGVNDWFDPNVAGYSIREHNGVRVGVVVAGFHDPAAAPQPHRVLPRRNGETLREGLAACLAAGCDKVYVEGATGWEEQTLILDTEAWDTRELETIAAARLRAEGGTPEMEAMLDTNLLETAPGRRDDAYRLLVNSGDQVLEAIELELRRVNGTEPSRGAVWHNLFRAFKVWPTASGWRHYPWATLRDAIRDRVRPVPVDPGGPGEEDGVDIIVHEDKPGAAFAYQNVVRFVPLGDTSGLTQVFAFGIDGGDLAEYQKDPLNVEKWEWLVRRMLRRAA